MTDPLPLDHTATRLWPSRMAQLIPLFFAGALIYFSISAFRQMQLGLLGRIWVTGVLFRRLFFTDPNALTFSLDSLTISPDEAMDQIQRYHRHYADWPIG